MSYEDSLANDGQPQTQEPAYIADERAELEKSGKSRRMWGIIGAIVLVLALAAIGYSLLSGGDAGTEDDAEGNVPTVTVGVPGRGSIEQVIRAAGSIGAQRDLPISAVGEGGQVLRVLVDQGDWVRAGQVLAVIDQSVQVQTAQSLAAQIGVAEADAALAEAELQRALQLVDRGFISQADVDRRRATRDSALARIAQNRAQLRETQARNARLTIRAPEPGLILERNIEPGQVISGGTGVVFRIAARGEMELRAEVSEDDLMRLSVGVPATVTPAGSDTSYSGQVWQLAPTINATTRQGFARIALPYDENLRPGGFATAELLGGVTQAPLLPESAILSDDDSSFVYIVNDEDEVERRDVVTGTITSEGISVAEGLTGDERVILRSAAFLNPGEKVNAILEGAEQEAADTDDTEAEISDAG